MNVKKIFVGLFVFIALSAFQGKAEVAPANQVRIVLTPTTFFLAEQQQFSFAYNLESTLDSRQPVKSFNLTVPNLTGVRQILSPSDAIQWDFIKIHHYRNLKTQLIDWFPTVPRAEDIDTYFSLYASRSLQPGQKLSGFKVIARNLPGVRFFWVRGFVRPPSFEEYLTFINSKHGTHLTEFSEIPDDWLREIPQFQPTHLNAVSGKTVGPDILPDKLTNEQLMDRLIKLKEEALQLSWIDDPVIAKNLGDKLNAARDKLKAGQLETASNILHSFIHDLEAQRYDGEAKDRKPEDKDKHINNNAFYLLKPNAEFILWRLGQSKKDGKKDR